MQTVEETRRVRLGMLIRQLGSATALAAKIERAESQISQYVTLKRNMGSDFARYIESCLELEAGWMDTPPTYAELAGRDDPVTKAITMFQMMEPEQQVQALRLLDVFSQPQAPLKTGS